MNTFELELLAVTEGAEAELEKVVAAFVQREHRLPEYNDLVPPCEQAGVARLRK